MKLKTRGLKKEVILKDEDFAHEAVDRTSVCINILEDTLANHAYIKASKFHKKKVRKAIKALAAVYCVAGNEMATILYSKAKGNS